MKSGYILNYAELNVPPPPPPPSPPKSPPVILINGDEDTHLKNKKKSPALHKCVKW